MMTTKRPISMAKKRPSAGRRTGNWELTAEAVLLPLLAPSENLGISISGATGGFEAGLLLDLLMSLLGMLDGTGQYRTTYIGLTGEDMVFAISREPRKLSRLQRASLGNVSIVNFKESRKRFLMDVLVIDTGKKKLTLRTGASQRPVIHEFLTELDRRKREAELPDKPS